jgi:FMN phosphatase YigB (HAD superfamily)
MPGVQAVLFDLAGVLVGKPGKTKSLYEAIEKEYGVPKRTLKQELSRRGYEKMRGRHLALVLEAPLLSIIGRPLTRPLLELIPDATFDGQNIEIVRALRPRYKTAIVANSDGFVEDRLVRAGLRDLFDVVIDSEVIGLRKPDERIYQLAARLLGCEARRCVFIDDKEENVAAARELGMKGIVYALGDETPLAGPLADHGVEVSLGSVNR